MIFNNIDFDTYFKNYPDANGYFGKYGGAYISDELKKAMELLEFCRKELDGYENDFNKILNKQ